MYRKLALLLAAVLFAVSAYAELPVPTDSGVVMIIGEATGDYYAEVELYYESLNSSELSSVLRTVYVPQGVSLIEAVLEELFKPVPGAERVSPMPGDASLRSVEYSCGMVTVDLQADMAGLQDGGELVSLYAAITNTLTGIEGVEYVNILINSRAESIQNLPAGVLTGFDSSTAAAWSTYQAEAASFSGSTQNPIQLTRTAALYFPSSNGQWLLPDIRTVEFTGTNYAEQLLIELINGTDCSNAYSNFLSGGISIMTAPPVLSVNSAGERVLDIRLSGAVRDYMLLQGLSEWQLAGSITATMCSFIPELDAVRLHIDGEMITQLNVRGNNRELKNGLMYRRDFSIYIGSASELYFGNGDDKLKAIDRAMSSGRAVSAYALMTQLISGPSSADSGAVSVMPIGVGANDLLGVSIMDGTAIVNMSSNFYRLCQLLDASQERLLVYSIVNTICTLPGITAVRICIEGEPVTSLADSIYLRSELMPNPGIIE